MGIYINKKIWTIGLLLSICTTGFSQSLQDLVDGFSINQITGNRIIGDAVAPALSIVRQQYRVERDGEFYGRKGKLYYGETYTLGVKISNSTILQRDAILPWENDDDYKRLNAGRNYSAEHLPSFQRQLSETEWKSVEFDFKNLTRVKTNDSLLYESLDKIPDFGLPIDESI